MSDWRVHPIFKKHCASDDGRIKSLTTGRNMAQIPDKDGYLRCYLTLQGKRKNFYSHRFVYECFYGLIENNMTIDHKDTDHRNNSIHNLECVTQSENNSRTYKTRTRKSRILSDSQIIQIRKQRESGKRVKEIANDFSIKEKFAWKIIRNECFFYV